MRVAGWHDGESLLPTRIAMFAPCHRFRRAGINTFRWRFDSLLPISLYRHFRFGFEPIVEVVTVPSATAFPELIGSLPNLFSNLFSRFSKVLFSNQRSAALFHSRVTFSPLKSLPVALSRGLRRLLCHSGGARGALNVAAISGEPHPSAPRFPPRITESQFSSPRQRYSAAGDFGVLGGLISTSQSNTGARWPSRKGIALVGTVPRSILQGLQYQVAE